jgi:hypothetical protein
MDYELDNAEQISFIQFIIHQQLSNSTIKHLTYKPRYE